MLRFQHCAICLCFFCSLTFLRAVSNLDIREKIRQQAHEDFEVVSWKRSCESHTDARKETWPHSAEETCWKDRMELEFTSTKVSNISLSFSPAPSARLGKPGASRTDKHTFCQKPCAPSILATFVSRNERMRTAWQKYKQDFQKSVFSDRRAQLKSGLDIFHTCSNWF